MSKKGLFILLILLSLYASWSLLNHYYGYIAYGDHLIRHYSESVEESIDRNVFIKKLNYTIDSDIKIQDIFLEKGYRWGVLSSSQTRKLENNNSQYNNHIDQPFQIVVLFNKEQNNHLVYIPNSFKTVSQQSVLDTIIYDVYIRDLSRNLVKKTTLRVWEQCSDSIK